MKFQTTIQNADLLGTALPEIKVVVEYQFHKGVPGSIFSPAEPDHVEITGLYIQNGLAVMVSVSFLLASMGAEKRAKLEEQLLNEIREDKEDAA